MNPDEYAAARQARLIERAIGAGRPETEAVALVDDVLTAQRSRIRRSADPDPLVTAALDRALAGRRERSPRVRWVAAGVVGLLVVAAAAVVLDRREDPATTTVPPLFGDDARTVTAALAARGLEARLVKVRACLPGGEIVGTRPRPGEVVDAAGTVTVAVSVPLSESCMPDYADRTAVLRVVRYALLGRRSDLGAPTFAPRVRVLTVSSTSTRSTVSTADQLAEPESLARALPVLSSIARLRTDTVSGLPRLDTSAVVPPAETCGLARPAAVGGRTAVRATIATTDDAGGPVDDCLVTLDLYRRRGTIDAVVVYLPSG